MLGECVIEGCPNRHYGCGWCNKHYLRWRRHGSPLVTKRIYGDDDRRFWLKVDKNGPRPGDDTLAAGSGPCWLWTASKSVDGYGRLMVEAREVLAHRYSYQLHGGILVEGMHVDHLCRNPTCVNPIHLEQVTPGENQRRGYAAADGRISSLTAQ